MADSNKTFVAPAGAAWRNSIIADSTINLYQSDNIKNTISFQLFGIDVIFNKSLHPYLLEMNKGPDMTPKDDEDTKMKYNVQNDMFKTVGIISNNFGENNSFSEIYSL